MRTIRIKLYKIDELSFEALCRALQEVKAKDNLNYYRMPLPDRIAYIREKNYEFQQDGRLA